MRIPRQWWVASLSVAVITGCNVSDAMRARVVVVADAAGHELPVDRLAEISARGKAVLLQDDVVGRIAGLWVDYTLFAQRLADGDSFLDSTTVIEAMWGEARQTIVDHYHDKLIENRLAVTDEFVDSVFRAGEHRVIHHILIRTPPDMSPPDKEAQREKAERLYQAVSSGRLAWDEANDQNEDYASKTASGSLGLVSRGGTVPQFETVAFALAPGEISTVTETQFGYHVIRRPALDEVQDEFADAVENLLIEQIDSTFLAEMELRWEIAVSEKAPERMRTVIDAPRRAKSNRKVVGTYRGGRFTVADYARWLQTLDMRYQGQVAQADDAALKEFAAALMRNHVLVLEAEQQGHRLSEDDLYALTTGLTETLAPLREQMGLDSVFAATTDSDMRFRAVEAQVAEYLAAVVNGEKDLLTVPPFLVDKLRAETDWSVSEAGVDRVVERAISLRAARDTLTPPSVSSDSSTVGETER